MAWFRLGLGLLIWCAAIGGAWSYLAHDPSASRDVQRTAAELWQYSTGRHRSVALAFPFPADVRPRDPIFAGAANGEMRQVGEVVAVEVIGSTVQASALLYTSAPAVDSASEITYYRAPGSMQWVLKTILPEEKRQQVTGLIRNAFAEHHDELARLLQPIMQDAIQDAMRVVEADLPDAMRGHRHEFEQVAGRYQQEMVQKELIPLLRSEVWPVVRRHVEPTVNHVSQELIERASLWRFGWRFAYDTLPLTNRNLTHGELRRFLEDEAVPVLEGHTDEFISMQQHIFRDVARDPEVRQTVCRSLGRVVQDPEVHQLTWRIIEETVIDNPRMKEVLASHWRSPRTKAAMQQASRRLEPTAVEIGEVLFGTPEDGLTPEFAHVLRNQVLGKDRRWLVLQANDAAVAEDAVAEHGAAAAAEMAPDNGETRSVLTVALGSEDAIHPFIAQAEQGFWN